MSHIHPPQVFISVTHLHSVVQAEKIGVIHNFSWPSHPVFTQLVLLAGTHYSESIYSFSIHHPSAIIIASWLDYCYRFLTEVPTSTWLPSTLFSSQQSDPSLKNENQFTYLVSLNPPKAILCLYIHMMCSNLSLRFPVRLLCPREFSRQEYWSGLPCLPPGDLPNPGIKPRSPGLQGDSLPSQPPGKPKYCRVGSLSLLQGNFLIQELNGVSCITGRFFTS